MQNVHKNCQACKFSIAMPATLESTKAYEKHIVEAGLKLFDVAPVVFPDHLLLRTLKKENELFRKGMLARYWRDNGPWALWRALDLANRRNAACNCGECFKRNVVPISCRTWDRFRWCMTQAGITHVVVTADNEAELNLTAAQGKGVITFDRHEQMHKMYPLPVGFNALTACEFMAPVSHVDQHIVIQTRNRAIGITYGRRLWECTNPMQCSELPKLDLLFASLNRNESMMA